MQQNNLFGARNTTPYWYALHTMSRHEKKVETRLQEKGVTSYLPLNTVHRQWSDRTKAVAEPLFSCYVFVHIALRDRLPVLQTAGAVNLVSFNGVPAWIPESQIAAIKQILETKPTVCPADYLVPGKKVKIARGPLQGLEGTVTIWKNNHRLIIVIDAIKQALAVEIDPRDLE